MEAETNKMAVVVTLGTTHFDGGTRTGYFFDFGDHIEYIPLMEQKRAFEQVLALLDDGVELSCKNCSLSGMYAEIQKVQHMLAEELNEKVGKLIESLQTSFNSTT